MAMFGTFIAYAIANAFDIPARLAVLIAMVLSALGAAGIERVLIRPFDPSNHLAIVIVTLSLFLILNAIGRRDLGLRPAGLPIAVPRPQRELRVPRRPASSGPTCSRGSPCSAAVFLVSLLLRKTKIGLAFRAVSSNLESSRLLGIHIGRTLQFGWALAAAVGTLAGSLVARTTLLEPNFMGRVLIYSFAAATLGGLDSLGGAVVAGIIIGLVQTMAGGYIDAIGSELAPAVRPARHRRRAARQTERPVRLQEGGACLMASSPSARAPRSTAPTSSGPGCWRPSRIAVRDRSPTSCRGSPLLPRPGFRITQINDVIAYAVAILGLNLVDRLLGPALARPVGVRRPRRLHHDHPRRRPRLELLRHDPGRRSALCFVVGLIVGLPALRISGLVPGDRHPGRGLRVPDARAQVRVPHRRPERQEARPRVTAS